MDKALTVAIFLMLGACTASVVSTLATYPPTVPEPPRSDEEMVIALTIRRAVIEEKEVLDYGLLPDRNRIVLAKTDTFVSPRIVPRSDSVHFVLLTREEIRSLANAHGHFVYLALGPVTVAGDSALVNLGTTWAPSRRNPGIVYLSGGGCLWQFRKRDDQWYFEKIRICIGS